MANLLSTSVSGSLSSTGRISTTYNTDRYQFNLSRTSGSNWWFTNDSDKLGLHLNGVGDRIYFATDGNIWSSYYNDWLSNVLANKISTSGGQTIAGITYFSNGESLQVYGIRGRFTNEYIHLYNKVGIGHPSGWGQGEGNTPNQGLSTYGGIVVAYGNAATSQFQGHLRIDRNWGAGDYGAEQFTIRGTYPSIALRSTNSNSKWLIHSPGSGALQFYYGGTVDDNNWGNKFEIPTDGNIWMSWANDYISNLLGAKQNASTAITTSNIGSQSVSYASNSGALGGLGVGSFLRDDGWNTYPGQDANTQGEMRVDFTYSNNAPYTGELIRFGSSGYSTQFNTSYGNSDNFAFRTRNGDNATWNAWRNVIHSGNISSQSVSYATSAGDSTNLGGRSSSRYLYYRGISSSGDFQSFQSTESIIRFDQVNDYNGLSNPPGGYTYGGVLSMRGDNFGFQLWGSHTGNFYFKTQWNNDQYSGWREVIHSANIGSYALTSLPSHNHDDRYLVKGGGWYGVGLPGSRWGGFSVSGGEIVFGDGLPNAGQMGILIDGAYLAGENNGFWSLASDNSWSSRRGMYWDGSNLNFTTNSPIALFSDVRAPIFYDSADTYYYVDPNSTSRLNSVGSFSLKNNYTVDVDHQYGIYFDNGLPSSYAIFREGGAWTWPYPDLRIAFHTGIKLGANSGYNGIRFYTDYDMATQVMSVNNGSDPLGGGNVYVNNSLQAGSSLRAPIFYDSENTGYYGDFASTSVMNAIRLGTSTNSGTISGGGDWGIRFANDNGWIQFGPANNSWTHIYTDKNFYFNQNLYVNGTQVVLNSGTWGINITGSAGSASSSSRSSALDIVGYGNGNMTYYQSSGTFAGQTGWAGYFVSNHGDGATYYNQTIIMPFWGAPQYSRLQGGTFVGPYTFWTTENLNDYAPNMNQYVRTTDNVTFNTTTSPTILVNNHSDNTKGYRIHNTSGSSVSAMFVNSSNQLVIAAGAVDQINLNKKVYVNGVALGVNVAPSATAGRIDASNDIVAYSSSDERLKENITPIENALDKVKSLTGVEFDWKPEYKHAHGYEGHDTGIIAQQVEAVMPSAVRTNDTGFLAVRYEKLIGLLIEGMKEQQAQIDELKAKLDGLTK